ncbi:hypothetical protein [Streptomyces sp. SP18BB07]|uniref:hypothetical protein n=1 Tax=Streptomyces sp. SP18BB07 TaxID=3002522 RepID=UPI002E789C53|nr:hypothetical protein [Streptomyces sp. SP18BB07]MEE1761070.1 hypothetical protein [Streptomyces sp. SP18BB07]
MILLPPHRTKGPGVLGATPEQPIGPFGHWPEPGVFAIAVGIGGAIGGIAVAVGLPAYSCGVPVAQAN